MESTAGQSLGEKELNMLINTGRVPHGVILESSQPQLVSRYADILSMWAVCKAEKEKRPCGECSGCLKAKSGNHSDIYTARGSGKSDAVSVDEVRNICNNAYIIPNEAEAKVFILPNADKMQIPAQNAFLKVLEEPPQNILFVLCCTSAQQLLGTIRSRAVTFKLEGGDAADESTVLARQKAEEIARALPQSRGYNLLAVLGEVNDREFAKTVLSQFAGIVRDAIVLKSGASAMVSSHAEFLQKKIKRINLIKIIETINTAQRYLEQNVNMNLFSAWLCSTLRRQK